MIGLPWFGSVVRRIVLPGWFGIWSTWFALTLTNDGTWGLDAHIYYRAAAAWLAGNDPWAIGVTVSATRHMYHFAAPPPALVLYAPFTIVPEAVFANGMIVASIAAAVYIVRRLRLAWWWLLFPPLVLGVGSANPGIILLALLLWGHPVAQAVAAGLKVYAVVPMFSERRWRGLAVSIVAAAVTVIAFSSLWAAYIEQSPAITSRLVMELKGGEGATAYWWLVPPTLAAVAFIAWRDLRAAGWLVVPALWPSGQFHYAVMALPVIRLLPAAAFAMPVKGMPAVAVILHAWLLLRDDVLARNRNGGSVGRRGQDP